MPELSTLTCPECGAPMRLVQSRYGPFYGCSRWKSDGCPGTHGAHPDGSPLGIPADAATKAARIRAHEAFDQLWKGPGARMRRKQAYRWLQQALRLSKADAHIGRMSIEECERVIVAVDEYFDQAPRRREAKSA